MNGPEKKKDPDAFRYNKTKRMLVEHLKKIPIIQIACEKTGIGRTTFYRWRDDDEAFRKAVVEAMEEGGEFITDLSESQLISMIKDKNFPAVKLWLRHHHQKYGNKLEIMTSAKESEILTPEQEKLIQEALGISEDDEPKDDHDETAQA